jgi:hypothetical protein
MYMQMSATPGPDSLRFYIRDSVENALRVVALIQVDDPQTLAKFDELAAEAKVQNKSVLEIACAKDAPPPSTRLAAMLVLGILTQWLQSDPLGEFDWPLEWIRLTWENGNPVENEETDLLRRIFAALIPMGELRVNSERNTALFIEAAAGFSELAEWLEYTEKWREALGCGQSAVHFAQLGGDREWAESEALVCLRVAKQLAHPEFIAGELVRTAHLGCQIAEKNPDRRKDAFDSLEAALRYLTIHQELPPKIGRLVRQWVQHNNDFRGLHWLEKASLPRAQWPPPPPPLSVPEFENFLLGLQPIWDADPKTFLSRLMAIQVWVNEVENRRLELDPLPKKTVATASWVTFAFSHPRLLRAIPHSESFLKEADRDNLLLHIAHETTHVLSVLGSIGLAAWTMRCAFFELETRLWSSTISPNDLLSPKRWAIAPKPAELPVTSGTAVEIVAADLARVEQELEIERKIQLIERLWAPWFEGLAVFGEHAADPRDNITSVSPVAMVVSNLFDTPIREEAERLKISLEEAIDRCRIRAEELVGEAQEKEGAARLRGYFDGPQHRKYLAGYLAVRSVVAAWRSTLDKPISGAEAFAMLLHATRYSGAELVPPADLPTDTFRQQIIERQLKWLRDISAVPREDLERLNKEYAKAGEDSGYFWKGGRILKQTSSDPGEDAKKLLESIACARLSLAGSRADLNRISEASEACRFLMEETARALEEHASKAAIIDDDMMNTMLGGFSAMPLGKVQAPFWLNRRAPSFTTLIRTREHDFEHGKSSYNVHSEPLSEEEFSELEKHVKLGAAGRAKVSRVAFLSDPNNRLLQGSNYLVFEVDDWIHIRNAGMRFGVDSVPSEAQSAIEWRLRPHPFQVAQEAFLDSNTHPCARRTRDWLISGQWEFVLNTVNIDLGPWARHAINLADEILNAKEADDIASANRALYHFIFEEAAVVDRFLNNGIESLHDSLSDLIERLMLALHQSGRRSISSNQKMSRLAEQLSGFPIFEHTQSGWDVVRPIPMRSQKN